MEHIPSKFKVKGNKVDFEITDRESKIHRLKKIKDLDEVFHFMLLTVGMNVFEIVDMFKDQLKENVVASGVGDHGDLVRKLLDVEQSKTRVVEVENLTLNGHVFKVLDGDKVGDVLARDPENTIKHLEEFYAKYFKIEFAKAYHQKLGV